MSSSRRPPAGSPGMDDVLRGSDAAAVAALPFDADLRGAGLRLTYGQAEEQLEAERQSARALGYADGWAQGQRAALAQTRAETEAVVRDAAELAARQAEVLARSIRALERAADELEARALPVMESAQDELAAAAVLVAETLLGRELELRAGGSLDAVHRALALAPQGRPLRVRLHPDEYEAVRAALASAPQADTAGRVIDLVPDATIEPAGCVVDCDATRIDAQLGPALARVREVLSS